MSSSLAKDSGHHNVERCPSPLRCPVCDETLQRQGRSLRCAVGHNFDVARQGYVNLWLAGAGKRGIAGDEREMLVARRRFLDGGYFSPLSAALNERVLQNAPSPQAAEGPLTVLDAGCGEGYYLGRLAHVLEQHNRLRTYCLYGMDLSKEAMRMAAARYKQARFFVADVNDRLLLDDSAVDVLLNLFAPRNPSEFRRVLASHGRLFIVIPGAEHLHELRATYSLLEIEEGKEEKVRGAFSGAFRLLGRQTLRYDRYLSGEALADLVRMTPNYWHQDNARWDALRADKGRNVHFSFVILHFGARAGGGHDDSARKS